MHGDKTQRRRRRRGRRGIVVPTGDGNGGEMERERDGEAVTLSRAVCDARNVVCIFFPLPLFFLFSSAPGRGKDNRIRKARDVGLEQRRRERRKANNINKSCLCLYPCSYRSDSM